MQSSGFGELLEGCGAWVGRNAAGVAAARGQLSQQSLEAVDGEAIGGDTFQLLPLSRSRALSRRNRIAASSISAEFLILKQQRSQISAHVPLHIEGQHTEQNVRPHMVLGAVMDGADSQIHSFQTAEGALHLRQAL